MDKMNIINERLTLLDDTLKRLAMSDSSVQYASHIREEFDSVILMLNNLKLGLGFSEAIKKSEYYFEY
jgi:hypothetical protein